MISLQNALEPSRRAASLVGPKQRILASVSASTTPATSGASGPTTTRSGLISRAAPRTAPGSARSTGRVSASRAMPTLPGAHTSFGARGDCASVWMMACSRAPEPRTRTVSVTAVPESDEADEVVDRDGRQRLIAAGPSGPQLQRDPRDRLLVGRLDDVDEVKLAQCRPLCLDGGSQLLDLAVDLTDAAGVVLDRLGSVRCQGGEHDVGGHRRSLWWRGSYSRHLYRIPARRVPRCAADGDSRQQLVDDPRPHQRGDVGRSDRSRAYLDYVRADDVERRGAGAHGPQQICRGHASWFGRPGPRREGRVEHVDGDGDEHRAGAGHGDRLGNDVSEAAARHVVHEDRGDAALALPREHLRTWPVAA